MGSAERPSLYSSLIIYTVWLYTDMLQAAEPSLNASEYPASTLNRTEFLQKLASTDPKLVEEWFKQEAERVEREAERVEREAALVELAERQLEKMEGLVEG